VAVSTAIWSGVFLYIGATFGSAALDFLHPHRAAIAVVAVIVAGALAVIIGVRHYNARLPERRAQARS
jgi:membrane protein DedA with SNARE-associated domain